MNCQVGQVKSKVRRLDSHCLDNRVQFLLRRPSIRAQHFHSIYKSPICRHLLRMLPLPSCFVFFLRSWFQSFHGVPDDDDQRGQLGFRQDQLFPYQCAPFCCRPPHATAFRSYRLDRVLSYHVTSASVVFLPSFVDSSFLLAGLHSWRRRCPHDIFRVRLSSPSLRIYHISFGLLVYCHVVAASLRVQDGGICLCKVPYVVCITSSFSSPHQQILHRTSPQLVMFDCPSMMQRVLFRGVLHWHNVEECVLSIPSVSRQDVSSGQVTCEVYSTRVSMECLLSDSSDNILQLFFSKDASSFCSDRWLLQT